MTGGQYFILGLVLGFFGGVGWGYAAAIRAELNRILQQRGGGSIDGEDRPPKKRDGGYR